MAVDWSLAADIAIPVVSLVIGAGIDRLLERRVKLITYYGHVSSHTIRGQTGDTVLNLHSIVVLNGGRKSAFNVRVGHNYLPDFQVSPAVKCTVEPTTGGGHEIVLSTLVPGEQITISYLYFPPILWSHVNTYVKSDEAMATVIRVIPTRQYPSWLLQVLRFLVFAGIVATLYVGLLAVRWAMLESP